MARGSSLVTIKNQNSLNKINELLNYFPSISSTNGSPYLTGLYVNPLNLYRTTGSGKPSEILDPRTSNRTHSIKGSLNFLKRTHTGNYTIVVGSGIYPGWVICEKSSSASWLTIFLNLEDLPFDKIVTGFKNSMNSQSA